MELRERIAFHRKRIGLTQRALAAKLGCDVSAPGHWEREGGNGPRNLQDVVERGLEMSMSDFWAPISVDESTEPEAPLLEEPTEPDASSPEAA